MPTEWPVTEPRVTERPVPEPGPEAPIYAELARRWQAEGRAVPGLPDPVWEALAAPAARDRPAVPGPGRSPEPGTGWNPPAGPERSPGPGH
ncbi:hypothetical protein ACIQOV_36935 [Kitasatospora sp. NPDC091257]|uniref:hypothetical protein n=1 Tax=Kitasatospora sp. NPDC091257 TaxID=3364084 RepID=UPI003810DB0F